MMSSAKSLLVEGGASHTWVVVADRQTVWTQEWLPSLNRIGASEQSQRSVLADVAGVAQRVAGIEDAYFAVGAASTPGYLSDFAALLAATLPGQVRPAGRTYITNDVVPLFFAEDNSRDQLVVIAGTGSGVAARRGFRAVSRAGSHEYLLGDDGGAFDIGRRALRAVIAHLEGRGPHTGLTERAAQRTAGAEIDRYIYGSGNPKQAVGDFARDVFAADQDADLVAGEILDRAAADIAGLSRAVLRAAGLAAPVAATLTGSLLTEPSGRLRHRVEGLLAAAVSAFRPVAVDVELLYRTSAVLRSDQSIFDAIGRAIPAVRM
jgi:N-acetylglucosamine kinase-like BadF-type ATPase